MHGLGPPDLQLAPTVSRETATKAGPAAATAPGLSHREAYDQWFARNYERLSKNEDSLHDSIKAFLLLISRADRVYFYRGIEKETGARLDPAVFSQALDAFVKTIGGKIMGQLLKDPKGLETWKGFLSEFAPYLSDGEKGTEYREGVEDQLLKVYAAAEGKATGLRIDHPDGLRDPAAYFRQLQEGYLLARAELATRTGSGLPEGVRGCPEGLGQEQEGTGVLGSREVKGRWREGDGLAGGRARDAVGVVRPGDELDLGGRGQGQGAEERQEK